jgi:hypothetical protein
MPDDAQRGKGIADTTAFDDFGNEIWILAEHISVLLEDRRTRPSFDQTGSDKLKNKRGDVVPRRESSQLQDARIKDDSQDKAWRDATPARVASIPRTRSPRSHSSIFCGLLGEPEQAPARA